MAGFPTSAESPVTPFRRTHVIFDADEQVALQSPIAYERTANQMARTSSSNRSNVSLKQGVGWRVSSYGDADTYLDERTVAQDNYLTVGSSLLVVASGATENMRVRKILNAEVTGIDSGSSAGLASTSAPFYRRLWKDTDDVSTLNLSTSGFNQPDTTDPSYVMDRIAESVNQYSAWSDFFYEFDAPGVSRNAVDAITTFYFPGPASETLLKTGSVSGGVTQTYNTGRGEYALKFYGTGIAILFERLTTGSPYTWISRTSFRYAANGAVFNAAHAIRISQTITPGFDGGQGGTITFRMGNANGSAKSFAPYIATLAAGVADVSQDQNMASMFVYKVPCASGTLPANHACNLRMDIRRDLRGVEFALGVPKYFETGTLTCDKFNPGGIPVRTGTDHPYTLAWRADIPSAGIGGTGAAVDLKLYSAITNAELAGVTVVNSTTKTYPVPATFTPLLYVVATLTSSDNRALSPTLKSYYVQRDAVLGNTGTTAVDFKTDSSGGHTMITRAAQSFQITGAERDVSHEMASVTGSDTLGTYLTLTTRSSISMGINTEYDPADSTKRLWLFDGYTTPADITPFPGGSEAHTGVNKVLPRPNGYMFHVPANGKWQRLKEANFTVLQRFMIYDNGNPWLVTDLVKAIFEWCGFDSTQYNIPTNPITFQSKGGDFAFTHAPVISLLEGLQQMLMEYLGWFLVWDRNAGTSGVWRVLNQVRAPYTNVAAFITKGPPQTDGSHRVVHNVKSYPLASTLGDGLTYTATAPTIFINRGTLKKSVYPPEGNALYVSTMHTGQGPDGASDATIATIVNPKSYNFDPANPTADPNHRDYLGRLVPIYYFIPSLVASGDQVGPALHRIARRIERFAMHAIDMRDFQAPIVPINNEYDNVAVRNLRYYDPVSIDGVQYIIRNVNPDYTKDTEQMQFIQAEKPNF